MKVLRFRIAWLMVFVAIVALNFVAIRRYVDLRIPLQRGILGLGALPMANVLAVGLLIGQRRPGTHPFLLGFEAFGAVALALYVAGACLFTEPLLISYL